MADVGVLRAEPEVFGLVASDPTVSRTIDRLADDADQVLAAVDTARAAARALAWKLAGNRAPDHGTDAARPLVIDVDATLVTAHSEKEGAAATFKKGSATIRCGVSLTTAGGDRGAGRGPAAARERRKQYCRRSSEGDPGGAAATARSSGRAPSRAEGPDQDRRRRGHPRSAGLAGEAALSYSVGFGLTQAVVDQLAALPATVWQPAYNADSEPRPGAWVIEATALMPLAGWPKGMRVIVRKERPHQGAQLRLSDPDGHRYTAFATNTAPGGPRRQLADLELRHRRRARVEDRIRAAKDTGLRNLPLHEFDQNRIWQTIVALACDITAWTQMLALTEHPARRREPKRLRLRIFSLPADLARHARTTVLHLPAHAPWEALAIDGLARLRALAVPG